MIRYLAAATAAAALLTAAPAHADDQGYINALHAGGVLMTDENSWLAGGYRICGLIREGMPPDRLNGLTWQQKMYGPLVVTAAQQNLCPDTLH